MNRMTHNEALREWYEGRELPPGTVIETHDPSELQQAFRDVYVEGAQRGYLEAMSRYAWSDMIPFTSLPTSSETTE